MKNSTIIAVILLSIVAGCSKEEVTPRDYPRVNTIEVADITSGGATFKGEIFFSSVAIIDHGFLWSEYALPLPDNSDKISLGSKSSTGAFEAQCDRSLQEGKKFYVRAFAASENHTVFGKVVEFVSLGSKAPVFKDFFPTLGTWEDTVALVGENFSTAINATVVKFDEAQATIVKASKDTLLVKVPLESTADFSSISISQIGKVLKLTKQFQLKAPIIESVSPGAGVVNTTVTISGQFLRSSKTKIYFSSTPALVVSLTSISIICKVPPNVTGGNIELKVETGAGTLFDTSPFEVQGPHILSISPTVASCGEPIKLIGDFFGPDAQSNMVKFDNTLATVISGSETELNVLVPLYVTNVNPIISITYNEIIGSINTFSFRAPEIVSFTPQRGAYGTEITITGKYFNPYIPNKAFIGDIELTNLSVYSSTELRAFISEGLSQHKSKLKVTWFEQESYSDDEFATPWIRMQDFPGDYLFQSVSMTFNNNAYVGLGGIENLSSQFWKFDPASQNWNRLNDFPGMKRSRTCSFVIGNRGYISGGANNQTPDVLKDLWEYSFDTDSWIKKSDLPISGQTAIAFSLDNTGYLIENDPGGGNSKLWIYNHNLDTWSSGPALGINATTYNPHFTINGSFYILDTNLSGLWRYSSSSNQWTYLGDTPSNLTYSFSNEGFGYAGGGAAFFKYDPNSNAWEKELHLILDYPAISTSLSGKGYLIGDRYSPYDSKKCYEFDPTY